MSGCGTYGIDINDPLSRVRALSEAASVHFSDPEDSEAFLTERHRGFNNLIGSAPFQEITTVEAAHRSQAGFFQALQYLKPEAKL